MEESEQDLVLFDRLAIELEEAVNQISILSNEKSEKTTFVREDYSELLDLMRGTLSAAEITLDFLNKMITVAEKGIFNPSKADSAKCVNDDGVVPVEPEVNVEVLEDSGMKIEKENGSQTTETGFHSGDEEFRTGVLTPEAVMKLEVLEDKDTKMESLHKIRTTETENSFCSEIGDFGTDYDEQEQGQDLDDETFVVKKKRCFYCEMCQKYFQSNSHLKRHLMIHTGEKPYVCELCEKSFKLKSHLKRHQYLHTGEKLHSCEICTKSFARKGDLKTHQIIHTGAKPHSCYICGRSFSSKGVLNKHMKLHSIDDSMFL